MQEKTPETVALTTSAQEVPEKDLIGFLIKADMATLSVTEKINYYQALCHSLQLNPLTQPFDYIKFRGGAEKLYANKNCAEQLRKNHGVNVVKIRKEFFENIFIVEASVRDGSGRVDIATGAVNTKGLSGEELANAMMKAETKAKRRATLSLCGLGMLDETEITIDGTYSVVGSAEPKPQIEASSETVKAKYIYDFSTASDAQRDWVRANIGDKLPDAIVLDEAKLICDFGQAIDKRFDTFLTK